MPAADHRAVPRAHELIILIAFEREARDLPTRRRHDEHISCAALVRACEGEALSIRGESSEGGAALPAGQTRRQDRLLREPVV